MGWLGGYGCGFGHGAKGTKYEKMLGSLIVESSDGKVKFNVGSGFTDKLRENPSRLNARDAQAWAADFEFMRGDAEIPQNQAAENSG